MTSVNVDVSDGYGNSFVIWIDPGTAPACAIGDLFVAMSTCTARMAVTG